MGGGPSPDLPGSGDWRPPRGGRRGAAELDYAGALAHTDTGERAIRLLGRASELETLNRVARQALAGSFALLQVEGETGFGKTRLLDELATSVAGVRVGRATCSALEQHLPYVPLAAALRDALHGIELDARQRPPLRRILPEISLSDPAREFADVDALEALVELVADQAPLLLVLDDLQWADSHTLAALSYLQRRGAGTPAAVVTAARSEQVPPDHPIRRLRPQLVVRLQPLSPAELAPLGIPDLHDLTGGNPRFVLEAIARGNRSEPSAAFAEMLLAQCRAEGAWAYRLLLGCRHTGAAVRAGVTRDCAPRRHGDAAHVVVGDVGEQ